MLAQRPGREIFVQRLVSGLFAGFVGLVAYDGVRWLILLSGIVPFDPFRVIEGFGLLILRADAETWLTKTVGCRIVRVTTEFDTVGLS